MGKFVKGDGKVSGIVSTVDKDMRNKAKGSDHLASWVVFVNVTLAARWEARYTRIAEIVSTSISFLGSLINRTHFPKEQHKQSLAEQHLGAEGKRKGKAPDVLTE